MGYGEGAYILHRAQRTVVLAQCRQLTDQPIWQLIASAGSDLRSQTFPATSGEAAPAEAAPPALSLNAFGLRGLSPKPPADVAFACAICCVNSVGLALP